MYTQHPLKITTITINFFPRFRMHSLPVLVMKMEAEGLTHVIARMDVSMSSPHFKVVDVAKVDILRQMPDAGGK